MVGPVRLYDDAARLLRAPRTTGHLFEQLEGALRRPEVRQLERGVGVDDAHQRDVGEVEALRNHLRAQQHRARRGSELLQQLFVRALGRGGVGVHAHHAGAFGQQRLQLRLHALGARAEFLEVRRAALGAHAGHGGLVIAVVAAEAGGIFVVGKRGGAVHAFGHEPAVAAQQEAGKPALVEEEDGLLAALQGFSQRRLQRAGEHGAVAGGKLGGHVDHGDRRQRLAVRALGQLHAAPGGTAVLHRAGVQGFDGGRGRTQHQLGAAHHGQVHRHFTRGVARGFVLLVGALVLLVDDDDAKVAQRGEQGRAGAHHHLRLATLDEAPLVEALAHRQPRVQHGHLVAEARTEAAHRLRREGNFRNQHAGGLAGGQRGSNRAQVDLRFARTGDAVHHHNPACGRGLNGSHGFLLGGGQSHKREGLRRHSLHGLAIHPAALNLNHAAALQRLQGGVHRAQLQRQLRHAHAAAAKRLQHTLLLDRIRPRFKLRRSLGQMHPAVVNFAGRRVHQRPLAVHALHLRHAPRRRKQPHSIAQGAQIFMRNPLGQLRGRLVKIGGRKHAQQRTDVPARSAPLPHKHARIGPLSQPNHEAQLRPRAKLHTHNAANSNSALQFRGHRVIERAVKRAR